MEKLGLSIGTNQQGFSGGFLKLSDTESMRFRCVPNQVLYQAEPLPEPLLRMRIAGRCLVRLSL